MNMNKALQNLYHAVSGSTTTKVNISKLLVDIHYAITGKESENKNNWSKIINSMADNWPEGGGGSSDFSTATVTVTFSDSVDVVLRFVEIYDDGEVADVGSSEANWFDEPIVMPLYKGHCTAQLFGPDDASFSVQTTGDIVFDTDGRYFDITGDGTITVS